LKLFIGVLLSYPISLGLRYLTPSNNVLFRNAYCAISGFFLCYFCFGFEKGGVLHSFFSILLTYLVLLLVPDRKLSLTLSIIANSGHLLFSYFVFATENYDIDFSTSQSVLTLRLIGISFDYYDGMKNVEDLDREGAKDQKENRLIRLPSIIEFFGYSYFYSTFLVGPQFPFRHYRLFINEDLFIDKSNDPRATQIKYPSSTFPTLKCFLLGLLYIGIHTIGAAYYPSTYLFSNEFLYKISFWEKLVAIWFCCKFALMKYMGIWLVVEGASNLSGIGFKGYTKTGKHWNAVTNVDPYVFETCLNLHGIVEAFNINTNDWMKRYVFKRLRFLGNKYLSQLGTLFVLAIWHGPFAGYFFCFLLEFIDIEAERRLKDITSPMSRFVEKTGGPYLLIYNMLCWILRTSTLHYGLLAFETKVFWASIAAYRSVYFIGHLLLVVIFVLYPILNPAKKKIRSS